MAGRRRRRAFSPSDLVKVDCSRRVVLASGGPLMEVVTTEGDRCLCEWDDDGKKCRGLFPAGALRRLVRFRPEDLPFETDDPLGRMAGGGEVNPDAE